MFENSQDLSPVERMKRTQRRKAEEAIRSRFARLLSVSEGCCEWDGLLDKDGYGRVTYRKKCTRAHRLSYEIHVGSIPAGMQVCHRCDNPACVRPDHLFLGSNLDNVHDRDQKNRVSHGSRHPSAKLSEAQVLEIRELYAAGHHSQEAIARRYGVSQRMVSMIILGQKWARVS